MVKVMKNFIGMDISKEKVDVAVIINGDRHNIHSNEFAKDKKGLRELIKWLASLGIGLNEDTVVCMEHTGLYSRAIAEWVTTYPCHLCVEMALNIIRSLGMQRGKNDKVDARRIALYAYKNREDLRIWKQPRAIITQLKDLLALRTRLIKAKTMITVAANETKAAGLQSGISNHLLAVNASIRAITGDIQKVEEAIEALIKSDDAVNTLYARITSVPGIGKVTACYLICYTNEFKSINEAKKLACYCGIAPFEHTSGTSLRGKPRVSHMANKILKTLLHMGALSAVKSDSELKAYYQRKTNEGKAKLKVLNAVKNKMIHRVAAVVRNNRKFISLENYSHAA
jgi:transposase